VVGNKSSVCAGGIDAWMAAGGEVSSEIGLARDVVGEGATGEFRVRSEFLTTTREVRSFMQGEEVGGVGGGWARELWRTTAVREPAARRGKLNR
jgi:hypothetical protein